MNVKIVDSFNFLNAICNNNAELLNVNEISFTLNQNKSSLLTSFTTGTSVLYEHLTSIIFSFSHRANYVLKLT